MYTLFYTSGYAEKPNVATMTQAVKAQYVAVGTVPKYNYPDYPVTATALENAEENTFLHSTDPAQLTLWRKTTNKVFLSWKPNARNESIVNYRVYKATLPSTFVTPKLWTEWWTSQKFTKVVDIKVLPTSGYSSKSFAFYRSICRKPFVLYGKNRI